MTNPIELLEGTTPGPWGISHGLDLTEGGGARADYVCGPNTESIGIKLATPWVEGAWVGDPEANANARLIAAAPCLAREVAELRVIVGVMREALSNIYDKVMHSSPAQAAGLMVFDVMTQHLMDAARAALKQSEQVK